MKSSNSVGEAWNIGIHSSADAAKPKPTPCIPKRYQTHDRYQYAYNFTPDQALDIHSASNIHASSRPGIIPIAKTGQVIVSRAFLRYVSS